MTCTSGCRRVVGTLAAVLATASGLAAAHAQSTLTRTPNLSGGWVGEGGRLDFHFVHRFNHSGAPQRQVQSRPTFLLAWQFSGFLLAGARYATRSALTASVPNEWEAFARVQLRPRTATQLALEVGYNEAVRSVDAELSAARSFGPLRPLLALRLLGSTPDDGGTAVAAAAGGVLRLHPHVALAADVGRLLDGRGERAFWGAGLQLQVPHSPHSLSLHAANTDATTLQSASRAGAAVRWGFEFTVPFTPARYFGGGTRATAGAQAAGDTVVVLRELQFRPAELRVRRGSTVVWRNLDPLAHAVAAVDGSWDSGLIEPQSSWSRRFDVAGRYEIFCTPHPFMRAVVIVE